MEITIRHANLDDLEPMLSWRGNTPAMRSALEQEFARHARGESIMFVAFADEQMVGTVQLVRHHADPELARNAAYLQALEVHHAFRRLGIGQKLFRAFERQARLEGASRIALMVEPENAQAIALYTKLGFQTFKESTDTWDGQTYPVLCLEKSLVEVST